MIKISEIIQKIKKITLHKRITNLFMKPTQKYIYVFFANKEAIVYNEPLKQITMKVKQELQNDPFNTKLRSILTQITFKYENNYIEALRIIKDTLKIDSNCVDARIDLVDILLEFEMGTKNQCQQLLNECYELDIGYWRTYFVQIRLYDFMKLSDTFIASQMKDIIAKFPNNIWLTVYNLQIITENGQNKLQNDTIQNILSSKYCDFEMYRRLTYILHNFSENDKILEYLNFALKLNPKSYEILNNLGYWHRIHQNNDNLCIQKCLESLKLNPRRTNTLDNLATAYQNQLNYIQSNFYFKKSIEISQIGNPHIYKSLIMNLYDNQQYQEGLYYALRGLKKCPKSAVLNVIYQDLTRLGENTYEIKDNEQFEIVSWRSLYLLSHEREEVYYDVSECMNYVFEEYEYE